ncbi:MAG: hypothetical protein LUD46_04695 [Parabacteroides sp.]|nr:hypothetical protein [Parabacteroides sp.]
MKTKQVQGYNSPLTLRLKIISGYVLLLVLLGVIVSLVWLEHRNMEVLNSSELRADQKGKQKTGLLKNCSTFLSLMIFFC